MDDQRTESMAAEGEHEGEPVSPAPLQNVAHNIISVGLQKSVFTFSNEIIASQLSTGAAINYYVIGTEGHLGIFRGSWNLIEPFVHKHSVARVDGCSVPTSKCFDSETDALDYLTVNGGERFLTDYRVNVPPTIIDLKPLLKSRSDAPLLAPHTLLDPALATAPPAEIPVGLAVETSNEIADLRAQVMAMAETHEAEAELRETFKVEIESVRDAERAQAEVDVLTERELAVKQRHMRSTLVGRPTSRSTELEPPSCSPSNAPKPPGYRCNSATSCRSRGLEPSRRRRTSDPSTSRT